jgi:putative heme-binding domain-containing protein
MEALTHVRGQEARTFARLARFAREGTDRDAAVRALGRIPPAHWPLAEAGPLLESLLGYLRSIPAKERTGAVALDAIDLARALAARLTGPEAERARAELRELGVRVIRITTVPHQMLFDKDRIVVAAGKPVEIVLENTDLMPHNLIVGKAGSLEELGNAAEAMATQPGAMEKHFVPQSSKVLASSRLVQPRETAKLSFTAPQAPGVYPYLCTYPGHWRRMFGAMYVVEDLEAYLAKGDAFLESLSLPVADELLKFRRPRTEWRLEDLASSLEDLGHGRSFGNGKQMFQVANCVACHRLDGAGLQVGPDLTQLDPKLTPAEILREVVQPSAKINEKFFAYTLLLANGKVVTGLIPERTPTTVKIIENALVKAEPVEIERPKIVQEEKAETSIMPEGLLNQLTREEILDLLAFVIARGDRSHRIFQEGCAPGH